MDEKIIVFGLGTDFKRYKELIKKKFKVIACTDNIIIPEEDFWRKLYIPPHLILKYSFDKVLICTSKYKYAIKLQLVKTGLPLEKILYIENLSQKEHQLEFKEVIQDMEKYTIINKEENFSISDKELYLIEKDKYANAGNPCQHYFAQDIWGAKKILKNNPLIHYDIGSRLDGFIAHLLVFREVNYIDIRSFPYKIPGLNFIQDDAINLYNLEDNSVESLSSFHALEHFGLGRYGDKIDPAAYKKAAKNIQRVLKKEGHLYIGVPVGSKDKLIFNAHRIFSINTLLSLFDELKLQDIAIIEPDGVDTKPIIESDYKNVEEYSCGLFEFVK